MVAPGKLVLPQLHRAQRVWNSILLLGAVLLVGLGLAPHGVIDFVSPASHDRHARTVSVVRRSATQTLEKKAQGQNEYRLAVGHAMDVVRSDLVLLFEDPQHVPDFSIFSEHVLVADARAPGFEIKGLPAYQRFQSTLQWSLGTACDKRKLEITAVFPIQGSFRMRWRLHLWPKDVLAPAKDFFTPVLGPGAHIGLGLGPNAPVIVEGYSAYELDPWTAEIVKHTIDITNPPMLIRDLLPSAFGQFAWMPAPRVNTGVRYP